jgi:sugar phosphate permease
LTGAAAWRVVAPFCVGYFVSYLLRTVNAVIAPELVRELGLRGADLGLLTSTYFLAFALGQLPVGAALDRFGARRVVSTLLAVATLGVIIFATGHDFATLALGRGLVGLGVSACLMGAFKAFHSAFADQRQTSLTGVVMSSGAVGALTASLPLEAALPLFGWRNALLAVAVISGAAALLVRLLARDGHQPHAQVASPELTGAPGRSGRGDFAALAAVLVTPAFWRFGPQAALFTGGFMAVQSLWAVPWLMTVDGRTLAQAAAVLLAMNAGMLAGQLAIVFGAARLVRGKNDRERFMTAGLALALMVQAVLIAGLIAGAVPWFLFGFFSAVGAQVYGVTSGYFPPSLSGRVSTAVNLLAFVGAFAIQWGIGAAVDALGRGGLAPAASLRITFAALWVAQVAAVVWSARRTSAS